MESYIETLLDMNKECKTFKNRAIDILFSKDTDGLFRLSPHLRGLLCYTPRYQSAFKPIKGLVKILEIFGIRTLERNKNALLITVDQLEDAEQVIGRKYFEELTDTLIDLFSSKALKKQIKNKLSILKTEEIDRLNEAIHCFLEDCNYSAVAMSVSAIEFRLLSLMTSVHSEPNLYKMTLGQLINEYLKNKEKYRRIIPKKYEPLLEHCNTFRVFSVHPKKEKINKSVATSILHMTFQFLLDKELAKKTVA